MNWFFLLSFLLSLDVITPDVMEQVQKYFDSDIVKKFSTLWNKYRIPYENALSLAMQDVYGTKGMNLYIKRPTNPYLVSKGYYHTDNQVHIILEDLNLDELPRIFYPRISLRLPENEFKINATVSKMFINADYVLFRNNSNIIYDLKSQDPYKMSPFLFEQVKNKGQLAITIEGCKLSGMGFISLTGGAVALGYSDFRLQQCQFNLEIYTSGVAAPPVIANYLPKSEGLDMEHVIMKRLSAELIPKLEAALYTYVNTSAVLDEKLNLIRVYQKKNEEETANFVITVVKKSNILTMKKNLGKISFSDFFICWNDTTDEGEVSSVIKLQDTVLSGLENLYSSETGGAIKRDSIKIYEEIIFNNLQVRGNFIHKVGNKPETVYDFAVHIDDVQINLELNLNSIKTQTRTEDENQSEAIKIHVKGWRSLQLSSTGLQYPNAEAFITGYLLHKLPIYIKNHLFNIISDAAFDTDHLAETVIDRDELTQTDIDQINPVESKYTDYSGTVVNEIHAEENSQAELNENSPLQHEENNNITA